MEQQRGLTGSHPATRPRKLALTLEELKEARGTSGGCLDPNGSGICKPIRLAGLIGKAVPST